MNVIVVTTRDKCIGFLPGDEKTKETGELFRLVEFSAERLQPTDVFFVAKMYDVGEYGELLKRVLSER